MDYRYRAEQLQKRSAMLSNRARVLAELHRSGHWSVPDAGIVLHAQKSSQLASATARATYAACLECGCDAHETHWCPNTR